MTKFRMGIAAQGGAASFITRTAYQFAATSQDFSLAGMQAGDLAIVYVQSDASAPLTPTGWNTILDAWNGNTILVRAIYLFKVLTSADITAGKVTVTGADTDSCGWIAGYRGATSLAKVNTNTVNTATLAIPGFTKAAGSKGIICSVIDNGGPATFSGPSGFASRLAAVAETSYTLGFYDLLPSTAYVNGTTETVTGFGTTSNKRGVLLELT